MRLDAVLSEADQAATQALCSRPPGEQHMSTDLKQQARRLRTSLADRGIEVTHGEALEHLAHQHGARDWNTLAARPPAYDVHELGPVIPVLRIFDVAKAREFYTEYLGFEIAWEHVFDDHAPVYLEARRDGAVLHLSEHHGDASPGATVRILVTDVMGLHRELHEREHAYARPGIETEPWGLEVTVLDPFANRIVFHQPAAADAAPEGGGTAAGPIEHEYDLACSPGHAFNAFTLRIRDWWHPAYAPPGLTDVGVGTSVGQGCFMRIADGATYPWGTTTAWERHHFAMDFTLAQDPDHPSRIDVRFEDAPFGGCRMHFSHGGWTAGNVAGRARFSEWPILLDRFAALAEGRPLPPGKPEDEHA
jgi:catechol 2,3-dioxygenase-like lactoylglutathione lyase family enzyme